MASVGEIIFRTIVCVLLVLFIFASCSAYNTCVREHKERGFSHIAASTACHG